jgi:hypothetical protein
MRIIIFIILSLISLNCHSRCRCEITWFGKEARESRFVFHGRVVAVMKDEFEFEIIKSWKGVYSSGNFKINTRSSCYLHKRKFELNREYLVYTQDSSVTYCSRTCEIDSTRDTIILDLLFGAKEGNTIPSLTQPEFQMLKEIMIAANVSFPDNLPDMKIIYANNNEVIDKELFLELTFDSPSKWNNIVLFKIDNKYILWKGYSWKKSYRHLKRKI